MKKYYIFFIIIITISYSCKKEKTIEQLLNSIDSVYNLESLFIKTNQSLGYPGLIINTPEYLIIQDQSIENGQMYKVVDKFTGKVIESFGIKGRGPNEMLTPMTLDYISNNQISIYDINKNELNIFSIDSIISGSNKTILNVIKPNFKDTNNYFRCKKLVMIDSSRFIGTCSHILGRYASFEEGGNLKNLLYSDFPFDKNHIDEDYLIKNFAFQYNLKISPDKTKMCGAAMSCAHIEIFDIDKKFVKEKDKLYSLPQYKNISNGNTQGVAFLKESELGFHSLCVTDSHIYVSMATEKSKVKHKIEINNIILKFDWQGNPIAKYNLNRNIGYFAIDEENNCIYAPDYDEQFESIILKFNLP